MKTWMIGLITLVFVLGGCTPKEEKPIVISSDVWIGAAPLYYAHAKGWLKEANIEMLQTGSIEANLNLYETHASDLVTATQHEYKRLLKTHPDIIPTIVYDRSYGGDIVLSNRTVHQLLTSTEEIDVFVELDTVGEDMLNYFLAEHKIGKEKLNVFSRNQEEIELTSNNPGRRPTIVVTYNPHDLVLKEHGFKEVATSKNDAYVVVDGIFCSRAIAKEHKEQLMTLKKLIEKSVEAYKGNPKEFYTTVKSYLGYPSYGDFEKMRANIQWIKNEEIPDVMKQKMVEMHYPVSELIK
jgi:NitT/TauT family transport system substrate-binding protein